jgi:hypothetical protein
VRRLNHLLIDAERRRFRILDRTAGYAISGCSPRRRGRQSRSFECERANGQDPGALGPQGRSVLDAPMMKKRVLNYEVRLIQTCLQLTTIIVIAEPGWTNKFSYFQREARRKPNSSAVCE